MHREQPSMTGAEPAVRDNVIIFPVERVRRPAQACGLGGEPAEAGPDPETLVLYAASAGSVAAESIIDMIRAGDRLPPATPDAPDSGPIDFGVLWGALLGISARHGQMAALDALETLLEEVREDPYHYLIEQRDRIEHAHDLKSRTGNVLGALMVESHPGPYITEAGD